MASEMDSAGNLPDDTLRPPAGKLTWLTLLGFIWERSDGFDGTRNSLSS